MQFVHVQNENTLYTDHHSNKMLGQTWKLFIDVIIDLPNIIVHFLFLLFLFWDDACHIYKQGNIVALTVL